MPKYVITQGGKKYQITVPEGTSKEQAYGYLQQHLGQSGSSAPTDDGLGTGQHLAEGFTRGLVGFGEDAAGLIGKTRIGRQIGDTLGKTQFAKTLEDYGNKKSGSGAETVGRVVGGAVPYALMPETGIARGAGNIAGALTQRFAPDLASLVAMHHVGGWALDMVYPAIRKRLMDELRPTLDAVMSRVTPYFGGAASVASRGVKAAAGGLRGALSGVGGNDGRSGTPGPAGPAPAPPSVGNVGSAGGEGERNNLPPKNQRAHSSWSNLDYYRDAEEGKGP